jgi:hypothetical protein
MQMVLLTIFASMWKIPSVITCIVIIIQNRFYTILHVESISKHFYRQTRN